MDPKKKPYGQAIADALRISPKIAIYALLSLLLETEVHENHDDIIEVIRRRLVVTKDPKSLANRVIADLLRQKEEIERQNGEVNSEAFQTEMSNASFGFVEHDNASQTAEQPK